MKEKELSGSSVSSEEKDLLLMIQKKVESVKETKKGDALIPKFPKNISLEEAQERCEQLELAIRFHREKQEEMEQEKEHFLEEALDYSELLKTKEEELESEKAQIAQLNKEINRNKRKIKQLEETIAKQKKESSDGEALKKELEEKDQEFLSIQKQFSTLRERAFASEDSLMLTTEKWKKAKQEHLVLEERYQTLKELCNQQGLSLENLEERVSSLQEECEKKEEALVQLTNSKENFLNQANHYQTKCDELLREQADLKRELSSAKEAASTASEELLLLQKEHAPLVLELTLSKESLEKQKQLLASLSDEKKKQEELLLEKESSLSASLKTVQENEEARDALSKQNSELLHEIEQKEKINTQLEKEKKRLENEVQELRGQIQSLEQKTLQAQQHLAKKVKESTLLQEELEVQKEECAESRKAQNQLIAKHSELQGSFEAETKLRRQLEERAEKEALDKKREFAAWEEKYQALYEKYSHVEARANELQKYEEKYASVQQFLSGLGLFMDKQDKGYVLKKETGRKQKEETSSKESPKKQSSSLAEPDLFEENRKKEKSDYYRDDFFSS